MNDIQLHFEVKKIRFSSFFDYTDAILLYINIDWEKSLADVVISFLLFSSFEHFICFFIIFVLNMFSSISRHSKWMIICPWRISTFNHLYDEQLAFPIERYCNERIALVHILRLAYEDKWEIRSCKRCYRPNRNGYQASFLSLFDTCRTYKLTGQTSAWTNENHLLI